MSSQPSIHIHEANVKSIVRAILSLQDNDIGCPDCFEQVDRLAELVAQGEDAQKLMPLVQRHLEHCPPCKEEFEALLAAIQTGE